MADPNWKDRLRPPWRPGESGNPAGSSNKQRGRQQLTDALMRLIEEKGLDEAMVRAGIKAALEGDFNFWRYIFERIDGPLAQAIEAEVTEHVTFERIVSPRDGEVPPPAEGPTWEDTP
jgi:hypothetical protein